ncbi:glycosyl hydrolase family 95 catalytic domain-containing protein [Paenibacillus soyae]|uniref:Glycoside hydrolase N-terminal domain-containing protein n=1 Tax=Paenibacillus soyae TaxID=2969249 RepID=A0A9X2S7V7_9BACL|nr:glycoside hydrolase N-terminal domain-containing protein [Paenibacillus soyae]MCR2803555.1 glycoside hydrolase N-terminal domain-containing protein [Paenibacillus soyae]
MTHRICFDGVDNRWNTALPLGNGKFGAMVFFEERTLHIALNHYDCYYPILPRYARQSEKSAAKTYEELRAQVDRARGEPGYERSHYTDTLNPAPPDSRPSYRTTSYPMAGEILLPLGPEMKPDDYSLALNIEEAKVVFVARGGDQEVGCTIWIAQRLDGLFVQLSQSEPGLWGDAGLVIPSERGLGGYSVSQGLETDTHWLRSSFQPESERDLSHVITVETALTVTRDCLVASVSTESAVAQTRLLRSMEHELEAEHAEAWKAFWRSTVELPDKFLETLWHLHMYLIGCASGLGSAYPEQACGLNGLWDIRRPSLWGSMWYWDVNIQQAFWPVFSSNHLELAKLFCEGYLKYGQDAERFARDVYGADGWALDYPHALYNCIQPWCAQFLWQYYSYSGDIEFLMDTAYPVFQKQIRFFKQLARPDENGILHIDPDISPEQGPVSRDSVITIASIKQLLRYAAQAAEALSRPACESEEYRRLLDALPEYARTADGSRLKDSALAPDDLFLRHPSVLMPIFPAEEVSRHSPEEVLDVMRNTLKYVSSHTETGMFGFGWVACAAAKLGEGTAALRILYEEGLDYILHSNGLGYEESERFINYCLVTKPPLYPPAMTEPSGGIVMAVNTMLLQADEYIEVFPAVPDGYDGLWEPQAEYRHLDWHLQGRYPKWEDCRFTGLLAPGGFEVSAERKAGEISWIRVTASRQEKLCLLLPAHLSPLGNQMVYTKVMEPGETVSFGMPGTAQSGASPSVQERQAAFTHRRVYLGEDRHTEFHKAVDACTCAFRLGNAHQYPITPYVFDFGLAEDERNYDSTYPKQHFRTGKSLLFFGAPKRVGLEAYTGDRGYGFASLEGLAAQDRSAPDDMRRDFIEGSADGEFWIELPRGKYNLLVVSGDEEGESVTHIGLPHLSGRMPGEVMRAGRYQCRTIPFVHERDGAFRLGLSTEAGFRWKLNALFLNKEYTFC